jgi:hypothetical protein
MTRKQYRSEKNCLNCDAVVERKFCSECGQENIDVRESFLGMVSHFFSDYFHFDSKFFRSVVPLIFKPGFLTKQYWEGKRAHYIHPLRLFFFITIIFMISTSFFYHSFGDDFKNKIIDGDADVMGMDTTLWYTHKSTDQIYFYPLKDSLTIAEARNELKKNSIALGKLRSGFDDVFKHLKYITFLLLPVYAIIFQLLYAGSGKYYAEHVVYTMHLQSFAYCLFSATFILPFILPLDIETMRHISVWAIMIYIGISLHVVYRQRWWVTAIKTFVATALLIFTTNFFIIFFAYVFR